METCPWASLATGIGSARVATPVCRGVPLSWSSTGTRCVALLPPPRTARLLPRQLPSWKMKTTFPRDKEDDRNSTRRRRTCQPRAPSRPGNRTTPQPPFSPGPATTTIITTTTITIGHVTELLMFLILK